MIDIRDVAFRVTQLDLLLDSEEVKLNLNKFA